MRKAKSVNGAGIRTPGDNRRNFAEVPAMVRPIPPPQKETEPQQDKAERNPDRETNA